ncbi:MAG: hypothetical protein M3R70_10350 [Actinomycetota bacterium]|nr:hypothetical protein [Actinomycetota bacterium]
MTVARFVDELDWGFGWISPERPRLQLASHALVADGRVWIVEPTDAEGVDERIRSLGEPAGVLQLLDRHNRSCAEFAQRLGVAHHRVPFDGVPESPFEIVPVVRRKRWQEVALWWPARRVLVCADALGTVPHVYALGGEPIGVHPLLRLTPPSRLGRFDAEHVLCGHGTGVHDDAGPAVREALELSRRRLVRLVLELPRALKA